MDPRFQRLGKLSIETGQQLKIEGLTPGRWSSEAECWFIEISLIWSDRDGNSPPSNRRSGRFVLGAGHICRVKALYKGSLSILMGPNFHGQNYGQLKISFKMIVFMWRVLLDRIPTRWAIICLPTSTLIYVCCPTKAESINHEFSKFQVMCNIGNKLSQITPTPTGVGSFQLRVPKAHSFS